MTEIYIDGPIGTGEGEVSAKEIIAQLPTDNSPIHVLIHSEGGSVFEGFRLGDAIKSYAGPKSCTVASSAFSIASYLVTAFDDVAITPNGYLMLHKPYMSFEGTDEDLRDKSEMLSKLTADMYESYSAKSGRPIEEIEAICKKETFFNAEEAVAIGLANRIAGSPVVGRVFAKLNHLPQGVVSALFDAGSSGNQLSDYGEKNMAEKTKIAATVKEIKAKFPKASSEFVVKCMEKEMPLDEVADAMLAELQEESEAKASRVAALEEELAKAKAELEEEKAKAESDDDADGKAKATSGVTPVAKGKPVPKVSARSQWNEIIGKYTASGKSKLEAAKLAAREHREIHQQMLEEANV